MFEFKLIIFFSSRIGMDLAEHTLLAIKSLNFLTRVEFHIAIQIANGLEYLHENQIIHGDLKPSNILFFKSGVVKLGDVGLGKHLNKDGHLNDVFDYQYLEWIAPEVISNPIVSKQSDAWSLGCILYYLFSNGNHPFQSKPRTMTSCITNILKDEIVQHDESIVPQFVYNRVRKLTWLDPNKRSTVTETLDSFLGESKKIGFVWVELEH